MKTISKLRFGQRQGLWAAVFTAGAIAASLLVMDVPQARSAERASPGAAQGRSPSIFSKNPPSGFGDTAPGTPPAHSGKFIDLEWEYCNNDCEATAKEYYHVVGVYADNKAPTTARGDFNRWKKTNGFTQAAPAPFQASPFELHALCYNHGELNLARDMHCKSTAFKGNTKVACYVVSYKTTFPSVQPQSALDNAKLKTKPLETLAMEYDQSQGTVNFFAYDANGKPATRVTLDTEGPKWIPAVCMTCHGGKIDDNTKKVTGANFLPFDTPSFLYDSAYPESGAHETFRKLNQLMLATKPIATIGALINGWYKWCNGIDVADCRIDDVNVKNLFIPDGPCTPLALMQTNAETCGWKTASIPGQNPQDVYQKVIRTYCRTCHVALPISTKNLASFAVVKANAAGIKEALAHWPIMPFAQAPYKRYWSVAAAPHRKAIHDLLDYLIANP